MKNLKQLQVYAFDKYNECKRYIGSEEPFNEGVISDAAGKSINKALHYNIFKMLTEEKRPVAPKDIVKVYKKAIPSISMVSASEKEARFRKHDKAVRALIDALVASNGFCEGHEGVKLNALEECVYRALNNNDRAKYLEYYKSMDANNYGNDNFADEREDEAINDAEVAKNGLVYKAVQKAVDLFESIAANGITDDELVERYSEIALAEKIIIEGHALLRTIKGKLPEDIIDNQVENLSRRITSVMSVAAMADNRMMIMSDPYYEDINLEALLDATPKQIDKLDKEKKDLFRAEGLILDKGRENEIQDDVEDLFASMVIDHDELAIVRETMPVPKHKTRTGEQYGRRDKTISESNNVVSLVNEIKQAREQYCDAKVMSALKINFEDYKNNIVFCDKNGNVIGERNTTALDVLMSTGGECYVLSKYGDIDPVPVIIDKTKDKFEILVGKDNINAAGIPNIAQRPTISWFATAVNFVWEGISGSKTDTMKNYLRNKELYEYKRLKESIGKGVIPKEVSVKNANYQSLNENIGKVSMATREKNVSDELVIMQHILNSKIYDIPMYENVLAHLIINKALSLPVNNAMRKNMIDIMDALSPNYKEEDAITEFKNCDTFKEFAWRLRKDNSELLMRLADNDNAEDALTEILEGFTEVSDGKYFYQKPISKEYWEEKNRLEEEEKEAKFARQYNSVDEDLITKLLEQIDNKADWNNIMSIYGPKRDLRTDWIYETSGRRVYTVDDWKKMQEQEVKLDEFKSNELKDLDPETFASLAMIMSQISTRLAEAYNIPATMPFQDILDSNEGPQDYTNKILGPVVEPARKELINLLKHFDDKVIYDSKGKARGSAKDVLANYIADGLLHYRDCADSFDWMGRGNSTLSEVASNALLFAKEHDMMNIIKERLTDETLESIEISGKIGQIAKASKDALYKLVFDIDAELLTEKQKREYIDDIMLCRAIQADVESVREEDNKELSIQYSNRAKDLLKSGQAISDLSKKMMSAEDRDALAKESSVDIYEILCDEKYGQNVKTWAANLKRTDNYIKENPNHEILEDAEADEMEKSQIIEDDKSQHDRNVITNEEEEESENDKSFYSNFSY